MIRLKKEPVINEEAKNNAKSLAENLNLELRSVVQRALPDYFELERDAKTVFDGVSDTQRLNLALEYVFLDEREIWLRDEQVRLKKKYLELKRAIDVELSECGKEKERLLSGIRYSVIRNRVKEEEKTSAPTNLIPSKDLTQK